MPTISCREFEVIGYEDFGEVASTDGRAESDLAGEDKLFQVISPAQSGSGTQDVNLAV
jgi:hypothetical protein